MKAINKFKKKNNNKKTLKTETKTNRRKVKQRQHILQKMQNTLSCEVEICWMDGWMAA